MPTKKEILAGRKAVDAYRETHRLLHSKPWHKGIPEEHTPLLNVLLAELEGQGFDSLKAFFDASKLLNIQEFGVTSGKDIKTKSDLEAFNRMWH